MTSMVHPTGAALARRQPARGAPVRLAVFTSHPIQYQAPFFRALAASDRIAPTVYFGSRHGVDVAHDAGFGTAFRWDVPLLEGYAQVFLANRARRPDVSRFGGVRVRGLGEHWRAARHDVALVLGWQTLAHVQALAAARRSGIPLILRGESTLERSAPRGGYADAVRRHIWLPARRHLYAAAFARVSAFLVIGSRNRDYYRAFGVPDEKLIWAPYCVDNDWFALPEARRAAARTRVRARLGASDGAIVFASSAKLLERKRPLDLLQAIASVRRAGVDARALFIGDGPERGRLERLAAAAGVGDAVTITGFVNQRDLPEWYAGADALVLPSDARETWGLVVNEAMAAGLPVVVSDAAGCAPDLVRGDVNGFIYPCGDVTALADRLHRLAAMPAARRRSMGDASRRLIDGFTIHHLVAATERAAEAALSPAERAERTT